MNISDYIAHLLYRFDCVVVPGLGGFVANYQPARFDEEKKLFHAPSKRLIFNPKLTQNDGLLTNELVEKTGLTYTEAQITLANLVGDLKSQLHDKKYAELGTAGVLVINTDGEINFRQGNENFLLTSYGFSSVVAIPLKQEIKAEPIKRKTEPEKKPLIVARPKAVVRKKQNWKRAAAATIIVPIAFYAFWIPLKTDILSGGEFSYGDLNPFHLNQAVTSYTERSVDNHILEFASVDTEDELIIPVDTLTEVAEEIHPAAPVGNYVLIGGCFSEEGNADKLIQQLSEKGYSPFVLDQHKGLHRVAINRYSSNNEAASALKNLKESGIAAWILKK